MLFTFNSLIYQNVCRATGSARQMKLKRTCGFRWRLCSKQDFMQVDYISNKSDFCYISSLFITLSCSLLFRTAGRAIRHKGDYACIVLADHRYLKPSMKPKLPGWIAGSLQPIDRFGPAFAQLRKVMMGFFHIKIVFDVSYA